MKYLLRSITLVLLALVGWTSPSTAKGNRPFVSGRGVHITKPNKYINSNDYLGKYVLIEFWTTWCRPCIRAIPKIEDIKLMYADRPLEFISVNLNPLGSDSVVRAIMREHGITGHVIYTGEGWENSDALRLNIKSVPTFILLDEKGVEQFRTTSVVTIERELSRRVK